jgi:hypothetical protein
VQVTPLDDQINRIVVPQPAVFKQPAVPPTPPDTGDQGVANNGIPTVLPAKRQVTASFLPNPNLPARVPRSAFNSGAATAGGDDSGLSSLVSAGGPLAIIALLARSILSRGKGANVAVDAGKIFSDARTAAEADAAKNPVKVESGLTIGPNGTPAPQNSSQKLLEDYRLPTYDENTNPDVGDALRQQVNEASGGQPVTQGTQAAAQRQIDIDAGKIKPIDYQEGEKPKPGTPGYKVWFKYRQDLAKRK